MATRRSPIVAPVLAAAFALGWMFSAAAAPPPAEQAFERVFSRFNTSAPPAYRAFRRMEAGIFGSKNQGWLEVWTEFQPPRTFTFDIVREDGSDYVRKNVLRKLLLNEQEMLGDGKPLRAALEPRNYFFAEDGATESGLQRVSLKPARKGEGIVTGALFVEPQSGGIVKLEGRLVKSPSFWVRDIDVTWQFASAADHVVPVEMSTTGRVRFYGRSYFRMYYDYETIGGQPTNGSVRAAGFR